MKAQELLQSFIKNYSERCGTKSIISLNEQDGLRMYISSKQAWFLLKLIKEETGIDFNSYGKDFTIGQTGHKMTFEGIRNLHLDFQKVGTTKGWNLRLSIIKQ